MLYDPADLISWEMMSESGVLGHSSFSLTWAFVYIICFLVISFKQWLTLNRKNVYIKNIKSSVIPGTKPIATTVSRLILTFIEIYFLFYSFIHFLIDYIPYDFIEKRDWLSQSPTAYHCRFQISHQVIQGRHYHFLILINHCLVVFFIVVSVSICF